MQNRPQIFVLVAVIVVALAAGIIGSSYLLSRFMLRVQNVRENTITVKGVAERTVRSDEAAFYCSISVNAPTLKEGFDKLEQARRLLSDKLDLLGFPQSVREEESVEHSERNRTVKTTRSGVTTSENVFDHHRFTYSVRIRTREVDRVKESIRLNDLIKDGWDVSLPAPEYFISNPEQYKLALVDEASAAATQRARVIAGKCGSKIGKLLTARQGVIQITRPASSETSDHGMYDTQSLEKNIRVVMTLDFVLE